MQTVLLSHTSQLAGHFLEQSVLVSELSLHLVHNAPSAEQSSQFNMLHVKQTPLASGVGLKGERHDEQPLAAHVLQGLLQKSQVFALREYPELH